MPKVYGDGYYTVVAENKEEAVRLFLNEKLIDEEYLEDIREIDTDKEIMWYPLDELPEKYHDKEKYPRENWCGMYIGVKINLTEAMKYCQEETPYIICISNELV